MGEQIEIRRTNEQIVDTINWLSTFAVDSATFVEEEREAVRNMISSPEAGDDLANYRGNIPIQLDIILDKYAQRALETYENGSLPQVIGESIVSPLTETEQTHLKLVA